jgi:hypothetical protein
MAEDNKLTSGLAAPLAQSSAEPGTNQPVGVNATTPPSFAVTPQLVSSAIVVRKAS